MMSKTILGEINLPEGITLAQLTDNYNICTSEYSRIFNKIRKLNLADDNRLWEAVAAKYPKYQILPETNHVSYIKNNLLASIYTIGKSARLIATSEQDKNIIENLNIAMEKIWTQLDVAGYQMKAGERAALLNLGVTQVGWDNSITVGSGSTFEKGQCKLKNINPLRYMRDPFSESLDTAGYVMVWDDYHKSVLLGNPNYKDAFQKYLITSNNMGSTTTGGVAEAPTDRISPNANARKDYYKVFTHWIRVGEKIHEVHVLDNRCVLYVKTDIQPRTFPFSELYCNLPVNNMIGVSEPLKIFPNSLAYNLMTSIILTAEYKNQRPPRFINTQSNLNIDAFVKHGNDADRAFPVNGDASKAVHYHQFPQPSAAAITAISVLGADIQNITGIDGRYTGRDTGSILTTGGINSMLDQVTMIDAPKVENYERYCKRLTQLIISNYIKHSAIKRKYYVRDTNNPKLWKTVEVDFPKVDNDTVFDYEMSISSELPKNKSTIANMANKLMEMQMQYSAQNTEVDLITPQEWLMMQDIPMREYMIERMGIQRTANWTEVVAQVVSQYSSMIESGANPQDALLATADTMQAQSQPGGSTADVVNNIQGGGMMGGL